MKMNGAQAVLESLRKEGVRVVFGYPGGAVLDLYDAIYTEKFPHILVRHEQGAAHAAEGYARAAGGVGVCLATSGPGGTNLVTGIATAYMDSIPMVAITGQVDIAMLGRDARHKIRCAGTRGCDADTDAPCCTSIAVCRMCGVLLMRHKDLAHFVLCVEGIIKRQDHPAGIAEYRVHALLAQTRQNSLRTSHTRTSNLRYNDKNIIAYVIQLLQ